MKSRANLRAGSAREELLDDLVSVDGDENLALGLVGLQEGDVASLVEVILNLLLGNRGVVGDEELSASNNGLTDGAGGLAVNERKAEEESDDNSNNLHFFFFYQEVWPGSLGEIVKVHLLERDQCRAAACGCSPGVSHETQGKRSLYLFRFHLSHMPKKGIPLAYRSKSLIGNNRSQYFLLMR